MKTRPTLTFSFILTLIALAMFPVTTALAAKPDRFVFDYDDTHAAPRLSSFCGFPIIVREAGRLVDTIHYDADGNYVFESLTFQHATATATNALTGKSLTTKLAGLTKYGTDGASVSGLGANYHFAGGAPIMLDTGRFIVDFNTGEIVFEAGTHDYIDGNWQALCDALAAT